MTKAFKLNFGFLLFNVCGFKVLIKFLLLHVCAPLLRLVGFGNRRQKRVLYVGQAYYNSWYLSRALRKLGWKADVLNWDLNYQSQIYYHGEDFKIPYNTKKDSINYFKFYFQALLKYDVFHFANKGGLQFGEPFRVLFYSYFYEDGIEIRFLKALGKKIVYSNNGCLDGVSQTAFSQWKPVSVCSSCSWQHEAKICSDKLNLNWGKFRNELTDYQCLSGGNRVDYNVAPHVHEVPEFYCLDKNYWRPDVEIPEKYCLGQSPTNSVRLYHSVGNAEKRTLSKGVNVKSSHIYLPLIERLRAEGHDIELISPTNIPNREVRYLQAQADIFLEMLTYGWFGANAREAMMLGKPVICFIRPEWMESVRKEIPDYVNELPIVSATPKTVERVLLELIQNKQKRLQIGRRSREFAVKWHSAETGASRFDQIYSDLLGLKK